MTDFEKCTSTIFDGDTWDIECKLGLWGVTSEDKDAAQDEALHYWQQYKDGGEYHEILGGESPVEKLS